MAEGKDLISALQAMLPGVKAEDLEDLTLLAEKVDNPVVLGLLVAVLIEERRKTNRILEEIRDALRSHAPKAEEITALSEQDERILELVREKGMVTAEDVKEALGYRGLNGASARLNSLYKMGILRKIRKGRKVYFTLA